ncbi:MAG: UDP-N-acetylmuramoyl-tripeptide--D-alanyl-D-alanine ligase [Oscillospiraceae bacterium]|jgi:UDP-N-acetylmuramoyl-tripeptide--D-alanyl-D-alanine ligase|nr:UDP-N-acetylmuramoyl-tripeptide--D-alanyl-D-alanine ligase [Oscillospiraceae bacterium]
MLATIILWLLIAAGAAGYCLGLRHFAHMLQLNSYKPGVQLAWMTKNWHKVLLASVPVVGGFFFWPRKAKKALVYTPRVKRLLATALLPMVLWVALPPFAQGLHTHLYDASTTTPWPLPLFFQCLLLLCLGACAPWFLLVANLANRPFEKAINRHYIRQAKQKLAACPNLTVIGITGSFGKTSTKHFLSTLLRARYNVLMTPGGVNTPLGVVRCVREELTAAHEIFLCEMGAKNVGDIAELCELTHPKHGVLTSIGPQHLESFKSLANVAKTKFELGDALPKDGILFANAGDENIFAKLGAYPRVVRYGGADGYCAEDVSVSERGTAFAVLTPTGEREYFETRLVGAHNVVNLVGAIAVAHTLGVPLRQLKGQMRKIAPVQHRLELIDRGDVLLLDDAYNANPTGAKAALDALALFEGRQKILVTPGMIELGSQQEARNHTFGTQAAAVCDRIALVGKKQTAPIAAGVLEAGFAHENLFAAETLQEAMAWVYAQPGARKVILLENDLPDTF